MFAILILHSLILHGGDNIEILSNPTYTHTYIHTHIYICTHIHMLATSWDEPEAALYLQAASIT